MCSVCMSSPCRSGCPNAPELVAVYTCDNCGDAITPGEYYAELDGSHYHEECFSDCAEHILLEKYGAVKRTAEEGDT